MSFPRPPVLTTVFFAIVFFYLLPTNGIEGALAIVVWIGGLSAQAMVANSIQVKSSNNSKDTVTALLHRSDVADLREVLGRFLLVIAFVAGAGIVFITYANSLTPSLKTPYAIALEGILAIGFASAGWYSQFMFSRLTNWSIPMMLAIYIVGGAVTVYVSKSLDLTFLQDALSFNLPFVGMYAFVNKQIVDYKSPVLESIQNQLNQLSQQKAEYESLLSKGLMSSTEGDQNLSNIRARIDVLERISSWCGSVGAALKESESARNDFKAKLNSWKKAYKEAACKTATKKVGILSNGNRLEFVRGDEHIWRLTDGKSSANLPDLQALKITLATWECCRLYRVRREPLMPTKQYSDTILAITEKELGDEGIGPLTKEFDRHTLNVFDVAAVKRNFASTQYAEVVNHIKHYPSIEAIKFFPQASLSFKSSLIAFRKATEDRIASYEELKRSEPDSYVIPQFEMFGGIGGTSLLKRNADAISQIIAEVDNKEGEIDALASEMTVELT